MNHTVHRVAYDRVVVHVSEMACVGVCVCVVLIRVVVASGGGWWLAAPAVFSVCVRWCARTHECVCARTGLHTGAGAAAHTRVCARTHADWCAGVPLMPEMREQGCV